MDYHLSFESFRKRMTILSFLFLHLYVWGLVNQCPWALVKELKVEKKVGVIVTLVPEIVMSSQNSPSMYQNFKVVPDCAFC
jgi:hypothetical protein